MSSARKKILVIKLGALGDFVLAFGPFAAIRAHHPADHITLLTTAPFADLARQSPWFDTVLIDTRPQWWNLPGLARLRGQLRGYDSVYDLQTSGRSSRYRFLAGAPRWSGIGRGISHPHANPHRNRMHTIDRQREQLAMAGIENFPPPDTGWLRAKLARDLPARFALLVPGASPHRPAKRWPAEQFAALACLLAGREIPSIIAGAAADRPLAAIIRGQCPSAIDLTGQTTLPELAAIAGIAALAVGNDTGPMHLAAAMGAPSMVLFSAESDPALTAPRGPTSDQVTIMRTDLLSSLSAEQVIDLINEKLGHPNPA